MSTSIVREGGGKEKGAISGNEIRKEKKKGTSDQHGGGVFH